MYRKLTRAKQKDSIQAKKSDATPLVAAVSETSCNCACDPKANAAAVYAGDQLYVSG